MPNILFFTQQTIGLGARKTSIVFLAEAFAAKGWDTSVVTVQLSLMSALRRDSRLSQLPENRINRWYHANQIAGFVWVPPWHPFRLPSPLLNRITTPLVPLYGRMLPRSVRNRAREADVIVVESCAAVALFPRLRTISPHAHFVYSMSDRLDVVGMHPALQDMLMKEGRHFDLIRVPAEALLDDVPDAHTALIPHGLDTTPFDRTGPSPFAGGPNLVQAGDMMLDEEAMCCLANALPDATVHYFGRKPLTADHIPANLRQHGEVPFERLATYIRHADVGLSLYRHRPRAEYIAQSSLKALQYRYCGLPVVTPEFAAGSDDGFESYRPDDRPSMIAAARVALARGRGTLGAARIPDWSMAADEIISRLPFGHHG